MEAVKQRIIKDDVPKGAVFMTRNEAIMHQWSTIANWKPQRDVWPLIHGRGILSIAAALGSVYINSQFRHKLKARTTGQVFSMVSISGSCAIFTALCQTQIFNKLLILELPCPLCLELRSVVMQTSCGVLLPMILTPLVNFGVIGSTISNVPYAHEGKKILKVVRSIYQPMIPKFALLFALQGLFGGYMAYLQIQYFLRMQDILCLIEHDKAEKIHVK